jgi:hypothetical protein
MRRWCRWSPSVRRAGRRRSKAVLEWVFAGQESICDRNLSTPGDTKLLAKHIAVRLGRARGDAESFANLLVRAASRDQFDHLELPLRNLGRDLRQRLPHGATLTAQAPGDY